MPQSFPSRFEPAAWQGPRARSHQRREDAFQQLIGHAVQEVFGLRAHVATTAGRDGSIDVYVDAAPDDLAAFEGWPLPLIIECKDHDATARDPARNVDEGWRRVREKLARQAAAGWPGDFAPWRSARSYLYCVSTNLIQAARDDLQEKIRGFFAALPDSQRPPLQHIAALDWADLRGWLDRLPRIADAWLGTGIDNFVGHEQFLGELCGFRQFLVPEALSYVPPEAGAETHPETLFATLAGRAGRGGVLVVGVGGVGKTRLALEVGTLAASIGWSVLHARAGDAGPEVDSIAAAVLGRNTPTLVVFDYLDQMLRLDPGALRHRLLPEALGRGQPIALLATARPGAAVLDNAEWRALLTPLRLAPSPAHAEAITGRMRSLLAPRAESILGSALLRQLSGHRPILTLFLCRELERRAEEGLLDPARLDDLRETDLLGWLRRRLAENGMLVNEGRGLLPPEPEEAVVAAAAVLAAAPQDRAELIAVATNALGAQAPLAEMLVENLAHFGWLEPSPGNWSAAHDVVADEVLEQVVRLRQGESLRPGMLAIVLAPAISAPRTLGRLAMALRRLILASAGSPGFSQALGDGARSWLRGVEQELATSLASAEPDEAGYALGAVISGPPWNELAIERWDTLVGPWLDRWGTERSARHLLYSGLRGTKSLSSRLVEQASAWLGVNAGEREASFVLAPLLKRLSPGQIANEAIRRSIDWLQRFPLEPESGFVLSRLLVRPDLGESTREAIQRGLNWLERYPLDSDSQFVLRPLLARPEFGLTAQAIRLGLDWLQRFPLEPKTSFVLSPLLARPDLGACAQETIGHGLEWLRRFPLDRDSQFVLRPLLARPDLGARAQETIGHGLEWLQRLPLDRNSHFVLGPLLASPDLGARAQEAIGHGLDWVQGFPLETDTGSVLASLLANPSLGENSQTVIRDTFAWLDRHPLLEKETSFVLPPLLTREDLGNRSREAIHRALEWLRWFPVSVEAGFILPALLRRRDLGVDEEEAAISLALEWLDVHIDLMDAEFLFPPLFARSGLTSDDRVRGACLALRRVLIEPRNTSFLLVWVFTAKQLPSAEEAVAVEVGLRFAENNPLYPELDFVLNRLLRRPSLSDIDWQRAAREALRWLRRTPWNRHRDRILISCLSRARLLTADELSWIIQNAVEWQRLFGSGQGDDRLSAAVRNALSAPEVHSTAVIQTEQLMELAENATAVPDAELLAVGIAQAREHLEAGRLGTVGYHLVPLLPLSVRRSGRDMQDAVRELCRRWLEHPDLLARQRAGFARECSRLLTSGAWPQAESGRQILRDLGLNEAELGS